MRVYSGFVLVSSAVASPLIAPISSCNVAAMGKRLLWRHLALVLLTDAAKFRSLDRNKIRFLRGQ